MSESTYEYEYLDASDKNNIISNHIRSAEYNLYNIEIQKVLADATTVKDQQLIAQLDTEYSASLQKISELKALLTS